MRCTKDWQDYQLIDCSCGEKLEIWGKEVLVRPDPKKHYQIQLVLTINIRLPE